MVMAGMAHLGHGKWLQTHLHQKQGLSTMAPAVRPSSVAMVASNLRSAKGAIHLRSRGALRVSRVHQRLMV